MIKLLLLLVRWFMQDMFRRYTVVELGKNPTAVGVWHICTRVQPAVLPDFVNAEKQWHPRLLNNTSFARAVLHEVSNYNDLHNIQSVAFRAPALALGPFAIPCSVG